jgi:hypothetical protein
MRPSRTVARAALTAALAIGALPGLVGSHEPGPDQPIDAAAFRQVILATTRDRQLQVPRFLDSAGRSAGFLVPGAPFVEPAPAGRPPDDRPLVSVPAAKAGFSWKAPRYSISGYASFYDNGTTAMRIPRGTRVVICGNGGCVERVINDYGPSAAGGRVVDMYRPDFFQICGCGWWSGTTWVTIKVY